MPKGRGRGARTPDLLIWNQLLYQLSYTPLGSGQVACEKGSGFPFFWCRIEVT
jgi:hypothetical protein